MPKVSVIIPTYNCAKYLPEAIDSVLRQTYKEYEIIIVDDGSTDNTKEIVEDFIRRYPHIRIRYFYQENKGPAVARNEGIREARGEFIAFLDADDKCLPQRLEEEVKLLNKDRNFGLVHSKIIGLKEEGYIIRKNNSDRREKEKFLSGEIFKYLLLRKAHICTSTVMVKRECISKVGFFDEKLSLLGSEDRELWLRICMSYKIGYIDKPLVLYRHRKGSMTRNEENMVKARYYILKKIFSHNCYPINLELQAYSSIHSELAYGNLSNRKLFKAQKECLKALLYFPLNIQAYKIFIKSYWDIIKTILGILG